MPTTIVPQMFAERARSLRVHLDTATDRDWTALHSLDLVQECLQLAGEARRVFDSSLRRVVVERDWDHAEMLALRERLDASLQNAAAAIATVRQHLRDANGNLSSATARLPELDAAAAAIASVRSDLCERWPACDEQEEREARAAIARGDATDALDLFAQTTGVSREEALRRIEDHKRRFHPDWP